MSTITEKPSESSDLSLAIRLQDGSLGAWGEFMELYGPLVESWSARAGLSKAAREDVAQEVFLSVHRSIGKFDSTRKNATFRGWLWRIAHNAVLQSLRKSGTAGQGGSTAQFQMATVPDPYADSVSRWTSLSEIEPPADASGTAALLQRAMDQIKSRVDPQTWSAFWNTAVLNQHTSDVAEALGMTTAAVRKAKSRTIQRLRKQLGDRS
ncbi:sigma-70 family RNA polymerase sigma factor [bacterium]|nr:sigma-70 family RNA polymerase sigma factor [bacterium]